MNESKVHVLLIEDNPGDARLVQELLNEARDAPFELTVVDRLAAGLDKLKRDAFQVVLLDLSLPDSQGLESLRRLHRDAPGVPIVVLTGMDEESLALTAVDEGAHDYLVKGLLDSKTLLRSLCYTVERVERLAEIERVRQQERRQAEVDRLTGLARHLPAGSPTPLAESDPDSFQELLGRYGDLMDAALDHQDGAGSPEVVEGVRALADRLGSLRAGPRAVLDLHLSALREKCRADTPVRAQAYTEHARLMALAMMGHLAAYWMKT